ncbi:MAG: divalent-cation tolerance protein CutA [Polyangia bacterium]
MSEEHLVVLITAPAGAGEAELAGALVRERLAACVNLLPAVRSFYRWEGAVHDDPEVLLVCKTTSARYPELERRVVELHPYDEPEVIALPVERGAESYLRWVGEETRP